MCSVQMSHGSGSFGGSTVKSSDRNARLIRIGEEVNMENGK